jgi:hypothetical protein
MATKNKPGRFDCYENAAPDEPMFILLARDGMAPSLVESWAFARELEGEDADKVEEARECARSMREWLKKLGKDEKPITSNGTYIWRAKLQGPGALPTTIYINTWRKSAVDAVAEAEEISNSADWFTSPAYVLEVEYIGAVAGVEVR